MKILSINEWKKSKNESAEGGTGDKKEYQEYFNKLLKKYGVKSPEELDEKEKKKFFDEVDKGWEGDNERD